MNIQTPIFDKYCEAKNQRVMNPKYCVFWLENGNPKTNWPQQYSRNQSETLQIKNIAGTFRKINNYSKTLGLTVKALVVYPCSMSEYPLQGTLTLNAPMQLYSSDTLESGIIMSCIYVDRTGQEIMNEDNWVGCCSMCNKFVRDYLPSFAFYNSNQNHNVRMNLIQAIQSELQKIRR